MTKLEVRCCCNPEKLLGWIEVHDSMVHSIDIAFAMKPAFQMPIYPRKVIGGVFWPDISKTISAPDQLVLELATFQTEDGLRYRALKSGHHPIETLRRISKFVERK